MKKILIIDDDRTLQKITSNFLRKEGFDVMEALDGSSGVDMSIKFMPDLILCDIMMPGIDGYEVHKQLKSNFTTNLIPFVFMTSMASQQEVRLGMETGADDYLTKPLDLLQLKRVINVRLEKYTFSIKRSESTYHALFELGHDAIVVLKPAEGTIVDVNQAALEILGYQKHELLGRNFSAILDCSRELPELTWPGENNSHNSFKARECSFIHRNGFQVPVQISGTNFEVQSELLYFIIARNLSDLKEKEQALMESDARYRDLVENTGEGLGLVNTNEEFIYANPAACEIFGLPREQLIGKSLISFLSESATEEIKRQTNSRHGDEKSMYELEINRPDGEPRWLIVTSTSQYDKNGEFAGTFGIFRDITLRKHAENQVRASEKRFREIVDLTNEWIWEVSPDWKYQYASHKVFNILGYEPEELFGRSPMDFLPPEDVPGFLSDIRTIVHQFKPLKAIETRVVHKNGGIVYLETSGFPIFDEKGNYSGYRGADRDITFRKQHEQELIIAKEKAEESDRLKSSILANISHELRTPLNGILGFSEILKEELGNSEFLSMIENIHNSGKRLMATLNSIITLSQLEAGKITVSMKEVPIAISIISVVKSMGSLAIEKKIRMETEEIKPFTVITDDQLLKQLVRQILDNAIKFTENGIITVASYLDTIDELPCVVIKITDSGIGIEKDYFDLIFQEFRQVSEGFGRKFQGSGIGLTISKKIIDLLKGRIIVESTPGKGSSFSICLPHSSDNGSKKLTSVNVAVTSSSKKEQPQSVSVPAVLLVEDNMVNKELTEIFLHPFFKVDHAPNGTMALEMAKNKLYHAVLMDISMGPGLSGFDLARALRQLNDYATIPIIAITGYTMTEDQEMLLSAGCSNFISKPFDRKSLLRIIEDEIKKNQKKIR
jgi:PAS domain S-box-containing protein